MKAIMISIKPKWVAKILNGNKTIEVRKRFPLNYRGWVYIYCTKSRALYDLRKEKCFDFKFGLGERDTYNTIWSSIPILNGKVVARFWCDKVEEIKKTSPLHYGTESVYKIKDLCCLTDGEIHDYLKGKNGRAIHITKLEIFDEPKELCEFEVRKPNACEKCWCVDNSDCLLNKNCTKYRKLTKAPQSWCYIEVDL